MTKDYIYNIDTAKPLFDRHGESIMDIIFATGNEHKMHEIRAIMEGFPGRIISMKEAGITADIEETGTTFEENALCKARGLYQLLHAPADMPAAKNHENSPLSKTALKSSSFLLPVQELQQAIILADDSGLVIDALNGEPGIFSARYLGHDTPYDQKNKMIIERLADVPDEKRSARFVCAIAAVFPDGSEECVCGVYEGRIAHAPKGTNGFGYDPIFYLPELSVTDAELTDTEKNKISHRGQALRAMKKLLFERSH